MYADKKVPDHNSEYCSLWIVTTDCLSDINLQYRLELCVCVCVCVCVCYTKIQDYQISSSLFHTSVYYLMN